jgi:hypothetical protein
MLQTNSWPTEWLQFTPLLAHLEYMQTGRLSLFNNYFELLRNNTQARRGLNVGSRAKECNGGVGWRQGVV